MNTDTIYFALAAWTVGLIVWTEVINFRARNITRLIRREAARRANGKRRQPRPARKTVQPAKQLHIEIEQWLKDGAR